MSRMVRMVLLALMLCLTVRAASAQKTVRLTFAGDVTLGSEERIRDKPYSLDSFALEHGYSYFFEKVRPLFEQDDLTIVNLEGVLSDSSEGERTDKTYRFRGPEAFARILAEGNIEMVNLANNHTYDYGEGGYQDTQRALYGAGIGCFGGRQSAIVQIDGIRIAFFGLSYSEMRKEDREWAEKEIKRLENEENVSAVVFTFHAGQEYSETRTQKQEDYAKYAIEAGADLVIMHHPHVVQGMSEIGGRSVLYSLGNFCFGGNRNVRAMEALVVAAELTFEDDGTYAGQRIMLYPAHISGTSPRSNYQPHFVSGKDARQVMRLVQQDTRFTLIPYDDEIGCAAQAYLPADNKP